MAVGPGNFVEAGRAPGRLRDRAPCGIRGAT